MMPSRANAGRNVSQLVSGVAIVAELLTASSTRLRYAARSRAHSAQLARCASSAAVGASSTNAASRSVGRCDLFGILALYSHISLHIHQMGEQLAQLCPCFEQL